MKKTLSLSEFRNEVAYYSEDYKHQFSYKGLEALFNYLEQYEEDTGEETEFDFVALCCEFTEYENIEELKEEYDDIETMEELEDKTIVIPIEDTDGFIIQDF